MQFSRHYCLFTILTLVRTCPFHGLMRFYFAPSQRQLKRLVIQLIFSKSFIMIIIIIYFENVHFFHATLGLDICPYEVPPHIPEYRPFRMLAKHFHEKCYYAVALTILDAESCEEYNFSVPTCIWCYQWYNIKMLVMPNESLMRLVTQPI